MIGTVRSALQVLLRISLSKGLIRGIAALDRGENRAIADGAAARRQVHLPPYGDLMTAPHLISFLSPIQILHDLYSFVFLE